jgi:hypothetical protein
MNNSSEKYGIRQNRQIKTLVGRDSNIQNSQVGSTSFPELMTEQELIAFLRIPELSHSKNYHNVIENLKRIHDLPRLHICGRTLYPLRAIRDWINHKTVNGT